MLIINATPEKTKSGTVASLTELKTQLNINDEFSDDDTILSALLDVAIETVEDDTHADLLDTANVLEHDLTTINYDQSAVAVPRLIYISQAPVRSVSKIELFDGTIWSDLATTKYNVKIEFSRAEIRLFETNTATKIRFTFTSGYTDSKRPKKLKQAVLLKASDLFDAERSNYVVGAPVFNANTYAMLIKNHVRNYW